MTHPYANGVGSASKKAARVGSFLVDIWIVGAGKRVDCEMQENVTRFRGSLMKKSVSFTRQTGPFITAGCLFL